jgi:hypothetical protein
MKINRSASLAGSLSQDDEGKKSENSRTSDTSRRKLQKRKLGLSGTLVCVTWVGPRVRSRILIISDSMTSDEDIWSVYSD